MATELQKKFNDYRSAIEGQKSAIQAALPKMIDPGRFVRTAITALQRQPDLLKCSQGSIIQALLTSAHLGLEPDGIHAALIPYKGQAQFQTMFRGLQELAWRSGKVGNIYSYIVYQDDEFSVTQGLHPDITHKPQWKSCDDDDVIGAYAVAKILDGDPQFIFMPRKKIDEIKSRSPAARSGFSPWTTDYQAMCRKTVIKQLCKYIPCSTELDTAVVLDNMADMGEKQPAFDGTAIDVTFEEAEPEPTDPLAGVKEEKRKRGRPRKEKPESTPEPQQDLPADDPEPDIMSESRIVSLVEAIMNDVNPMGGKKVTADKWDEFVHEAQVKFGETDAVHWMEYKRPALVYILTCVEMLTGRPPSIRS